MRADTPASAPPSIDTQKAQETLFQLRCTEDGEALHRSLQWRIRKMKSHACLLIGGHRFSAAGGRAGAIGATAISRYRRLIYALTAVA